MRFKPVDQSYAAYVLDLRSRFLPSAPSVSINDDESWRALALKLEKDYNGLRALYEAEQIKSLSLASRNVAGSSPSQSNSEQTSSTITSDTTKKKTKKKASATAENFEKSWETTLRLDLVTIIEGNAHCNATVVKGGDPGFLLSALDTFFELASLNNHPDAQETLLLSTSLRTIEAISTILKGIFFRSTPNFVAHVKLVDILCTVLRHVLGTALSLLTCTKMRNCSGNLEQLDILMANLLDLIFLPVIRCFLPLSEMFLTTLLRAEKATQDSEDASDSDHNENHLKTLIPVDIRPNALFLFRTVFCILFSKSPPSLSLSRSSGWIKPSFGVNPNGKIGYMLDSLRFSLTLQALRELHSVVFDTGRENTSSNRNVACNSTPAGASIGFPQPDTTRDEETERRINRLATKDALWYLCSVLHFVSKAVSGRSFLPLSNNQAAAEPSIAREFSEVLRDVRDKAAEEETATFLQQAILESLFELITKCNHCQAPEGHAKMELKKRAGRVVGENNFGRLSHLVEPGRQVEPRRRDTYSGKSVQAQIQESDMRIEGNLQHGQGSLPLFNDGITAHDASISGCAGGRCDEPQGHPSHDTIKGAPLLPGPICQTEESCISVVDEVAYDMILGVVERLVIDLDYSREMLKSVDAPEVTS